MWIENPIFQEDLDYAISVPFVPWEKMQGSTILVTGATGLIGFNLVSTLLYAELQKGLSLKILALVRDEEKAKVRFRSVLGAGASLSFVVGDIEHIPYIEDPIDFIVHCGGPTASRYFVEFPVETIQENVIGATQLLELARKKMVEEFLFLSSMEVYGEIHRKEKVSEAHESFIDTMAVRSSYPEVKRMVEAMCASYFFEYNVPGKVIRLTQTFGPGVQRGDSRVFAQFLRSAMHGEDIVLHTEGRTERSYIYTMDAVTAILTVLLKGRPGEAYNAANEKTYISIRDMAQLVANLSIHTMTGKKIQVLIDRQGKDVSLYLPELYMDLDTKKLCALGWNAKWNLEEMFMRMYKTME